MTPTSGRFVRSLLLLIPMALIGALLSASPAHAASRTFYDANEPGTFDDVRRVSYKAGWYWNKFQIEWRPPGQGGEWAMVFIDTNPNRAGHEFRVVHDGQFPRILTVERDNGHGWDVVCTNRYASWANRTRYGKFGLGCLRKNGNLPTRLRIRVRTEDYAGNRLDAAPGVGRWSRWIRVAPHP